MKKKIFSIFMIILILFNNQAVKAVQNDVEYMEVYNATVKFIKVDAFKQDDIDPDYYSQMYRIYTENLELSEYLIYSLKRNARRKLYRKRSRGKNANL